MYNVMDDKHLFLTGLYDDTLLRMSCSKETPRTVNQTAHETDLEQYPVRYNIFITDE